MHQIFIFYLSFLLRSRKLKHVHIQEPFRPRLTFTNSNLSCIKLPFSRGQQIHFQLSFSLWPSFICQNFHALKPRFSQLNKVYIQVAFTPRPAIMHLSFPCIQGPSLGIEQVLSPPSFLPFSPRPTNPIDDSFSPSTRLRHCVLQRPLR